MWGSRVGTFFFLALNHVERALVAATAPSKKNSALHEKGIRIKTYSTQ